METPERRDLYQQFSAEEEVERISFHYENDPEFFKIVTGDQWWTYSSPLWEDAALSLTQAQESKFAWYAQQMNLAPGKKILDVGCGWGGPLVHFCKHYQVSGVGISVSPRGLTVARQRAQDYGVDAQFLLSHWQHLPDTPQFDAIYTDEVMVHIPDLTAFFKKCHRMLKPGGRMVHKDLHFVHSKYKHAKDPLSQHVNKMYAYSGHYRTLVDMLAALDEAGFHLDQIKQIPIEHYKRTMDEVWIPNINANRDYLEKLTSFKHTREFKLYLKAILLLFRQNIFNLHMVSAAKVD
ncbi:MAG: methyltransferase domain-containing protein [Moraxellaceae bacterium]|nr:MAG: methyltransferase domain-containing protein [Moraxellaceae bacterium]